MKGLIAVMAFLLLCAASPAHGKPSVITTYPYIASIASEITGRLAEVRHLAQGDRDPHFIVPKPSFIAQLRQADLLIINGADLEIGWLPALLKQANNPRILPGSPGLLILSEHVALIDRQESVSRAGGDVHPEGNPHFHLDPENIPVISKAILNALCRLDRGNCGAYEKNHMGFTLKWQQRSAQWQATLKPLAGTKAFQYHRLYDYLLRRIGITVAGTLEPVPGIPPSARHADGLISLAQKERVAFILQDVYHSRKTADYISGRTGAKTILLPHDVGATRESGDIFSLFDDITRRLLN